MIIGLSGYARAGKDTVGEILVREHGFKRLAFADALRAMAYALDPIVDQFGGRLRPRVDHWGWEQCKTKYPEIRRFLQRLGTEAGREVLGEDVWVTIVEDKIFGDPDQDYVITDVRFPNEAEMVDSWTGGSVVRVVRPRTAPANRHKSETALDHWEFDYVLVNDGTIDDLGFEVKRMVEELRGQQ